MTARTKRNPATDNGAESHKSNPANGGEKDSQDKGVYSPLEAFKHEQESRKKKIDELLERNKEVLQKIDDLNSTLKRLSYLQLEVLMPHLKKEYGLSASLIKSQWKSIHSEETKEEKEDLIEKLFKTPEPANYEVDPRRLLTAIIRKLEEHIIFKTGYEGDQVYSCALWILATWCIDYLDYASYIMITAPEPRCGKSQLLSLLAKMAYKPLQTSNITASALFRVVEEYHPTIFIDEADSFLKQDNGQLAGILKAGIDRENCITLRTEDEGSTRKVKAYNVFGFKAICGISVKNIDGPLTDRCINIELTRKLKEVKVKKLIYTDKSTWEKIRSECARFALDIREFLETHQPEEPAELDDRAGDRWRALFAIADYLDQGTGNQEYGEWARKTAVRITNSVEVEPSIKKQLLLDIRDKLADLGTYTDYVESSELLNALTSDSDLFWKDYNFGRGLSSKKLASFLSEFGIKATNKGPRRKRAYQKADLIKVFEHYLETST